MHECSGPTMRASQDIAMNTPHPGEPALDGVARLSPSRTSPDASPPPARPSPGDAHRRRASAPRARLPLARLLRAAQWAVTLALVAFLVLPVAMSILPCL